MDLVWNRTSAPTRPIIFVAHSRADLAVWGRVLTKLANYFRVADKEIVGVLRPGSEMLAVLQQTFHPMLENLEENRRKKIELFCFYEEVPIIALGFVSLNFSLSS